MTVRDILQKILWAESNPVKVSTIVSNANNFARQHLSEHAMTCYSVQLLDEYSRLFADSAKLHQLASEGAFADAEVYDLT